MQKTQSQNITENIKARTEGVLHIFQMWHHFLGNIFSSFCQKSVKLWLAPQSQILLQKISHKTSSQVFTAVTALCCECVVLWLDTDITEKHAAFLS